MSKKIDTSDLSKLSEEDLTYLLERGKITTDQLPKGKAESVKQSVAEDGGGAADPGTTVILEELGVAELKQEAAKRELSKAGSKQDLIDRIRAYDEDTIEE